MRDITYPPIIMSAYGFFRAFNIRFSLTGGEHIPRVGGAVLASSHVSYFDFIFCGYAARPSKRLVRFMAKKSTFDHAVSGPLMRSMHHIPVDRSAGAASLDHASQRPHNPSTIRFMLFTKMLSAPPPDRRVKPGALVAENRSMALPRKPGKVFGGASSEPAIKRSRGRGERVGRE